MTLNADYIYNGEKFRFTSEMRSDFQKYGYVVLRQLLDEEEIENVKKGVENNAEIAKNTWAVADAEGRYARLAAWHSAGDDITGMVARCEKVVNTAEGVLGGEVYHYYTKLMLKDPKNPETGGAHEWHQDYGYWYQNNILFPDMITVFIAIDRAHKGNGCLQILEGSNRCGRIDHTFVAGQQGADTERVKAIIEVCPLKYVELNPGDALFFHSNLLHCSAPNNSQDRRYAFLITYNKATNSAATKHHFKSYTPLKKVPNCSIRECRNYEISDFYDPATQKKQTSIPTKVAADP